MDDILHIQVALPASKLGAFYSAVGALLGGVASPAPKASAAPSPNSPAPTTTAGTEGADLEDKATAAVNGVADVADGTVDAAGWPWSPELHAATKGTTKDGLWRMKVGVARPDPKPGFPKTDAAQTGGTGTASDGAASTASATAASPAAGAADDDDEFAAFSAAAAKANAGDAAAAASIPARKWTDADLGALCNQAAVKLNDPAPVKALIADFVGEGNVPHSRNIPEDKREAFAKAVEAKAGIEFAG